MRCQIAASIDRRLNRPLTYRADTRRRVIGALYPGFGPVRRERLVFQLFQVLFERQAVQRARLAGPECLQGAEPIAAAGQEIIHCEPVMARALERLAAVIAGLDDSLA